MPPQLNRPNRQITASGDNKAQLSLTRPVDNVQPRIRPANTNVLDYNATPLHPIVSCVDGRQHPDFPLTLKAFHRLTSQQLDNLARFYHQVYPPLAESYWYPCSMTKPWIGAPDEAAVAVDTKRRRFGRFIGLYPDPDEYRPWLEFVDKKPKAKSKWSLFFGGCFGGDE